MYLPSNIWQQPEQNNIILKNWKLVALLMLYIFVYKWSSLLCKKGNCVIYSAAKISTEKKYFNIKQFLDNLFSMVGCKSFRSVEQAYR